MKQVVGADGLVSTADRARWVARYRSSGLGLLEFAESHGLNRGRLHYWIYGRGRVKEEAIAKPPVFREVRLPIAGPDHPKWAAELALPDGVTLRLSAGTDPDWIGSVVNSLRRPCSH